MSIRNNVCYAKRTFSVGALPALVTGLQRFIAITNVQTHFDINSFKAQASLVNRERLTALCFHIFGSMHAMETEIPPFDSEIKDLTNSSV